VYRFLLLSFVLGAGVAHAEFARWTSKDGKAAELELLKLETKDEAEMVTFKTRAGKTVTMKLTDLQEGEWQRARDAMAAAPATKTETAAPGKVEVKLDAAQVHAKQEVEGGAPIPGKLEFRFSVSGANYAGVKPETLEVPAFRLGNRIVPSRSWGIVGYGANGGTSPVPLTLTSQGNFDAAKLSGSKLSATVTAMFGTVIKTARVELKVPKDDSKPTVGMAGPIEVHLTRDLKKINLATNAKIPQQLVSYRIEGDESQDRFSVDILKAGETVPVMVSYWEALKEQPLKLEATAP
jgi:hypothetical protein